MSRRGSGSVPFFPLHLSHLANQSCDPTRCKSWRDAKVDVTVTGGGGVRRRVLWCSLLMGLLLAVSFIPARAAEPADIGAAVRSLSIFSDAKWIEHYRAPNDTQIEQLLDEQHISLSDPEAKSAAIQAFRQEWAKRNPTTPNPKKYQKLLEQERLGKPIQGAQPQIMSLAVPVEFPNSDTFFDSYASATVTTTGPLHNQIPPPGPRDNNTVWYQDATPDLYSELYFGVGPSAGIIVHHPNLGDVDLRGNTMANFYLEQSEGKFVPKGEVYRKWLQAAHSEGWYGADSATNDNVRAADLVREVVNAVNADDPNFPWQDYDGDGDGVVDNFTVIHAGMGQEAGGGQQGTYSIWSHASGINYPTGYLACAAGTHGATRNIYVREYSMDPENLDVGVICEEYGHAAFGLPDIYTTDYQASPCNWAIMEAGSWNGPLGGMQPAPFPLFFRYIVGWANPVDLKYDTSSTLVKVGQLSLRPKGTQQGIKIDLPDTVIDIPNEAGTGQAWWSDRANLADFYLAHEFNLAGATAPIFSFASYWSFEADYDYGYFEVSDDDGATWTNLPDMDGIFVDDGSGNLGLNGEGEGTLRFDLAAYAGKSITLRLHYTSDVGVQWDGWWADDFRLADGATTLFSDNVESPPNGWTTNHFVIVPLTRTYPVYYLAEWRNLSGFDRGLVYPYTTIYNNPDTTEWQVDRCPYTVPGMLLWLRNAARDFDYTLIDSLYDQPSYGPKHALLVVDSHYWPLEWEGMGTTGAHLRLNSRAQPGNATFTLQPTTPFTVRRSDVAGSILETKTFTPLAPVSQFHDSLGYYPGLRFRPENNGLYFWDVAASLVVPAKGDYTTKITDAAKNPLYDLYDYDLGDTVLGSGDPRDSGVQYGINIAVVDKAKDGTWGKIAVWNATALTDLKMNVNKVTAMTKQLLVYTLKVKNLGPAPQPFTVRDKIPDNTTYVSGMYYNAGSNSIEWNGTVGANQTKVLMFIVRVNSGTPSGTMILNTATLSDDGAGGGASSSTRVSGR
jgi:immune inhibitor A